MSLSITLVIPKSLEKPIDELEKCLNQIDPPKTRGAPRKISNRDLAVKLMYLLYKGVSWRSLGEGSDAARKRFIRLSRKKSFEFFFLQLHPQAKTLWAYKRF